MAFILNIETATPLCSVALANDGHVTAIRDTFEEKSHASMLTVFIEELLKEHNLRVPDLDAIAVGKGPGSYTGLRIGVSAAKGLCFGAKIPLIAIDTLKILYESVLPGNKDPESLYCSMIDARRMEVYCCIYDASGKELEPISAKIIEASTFSSYLNNHRVHFFGSGMEKCRQILNHPNAIFIPEVYPHSSALARLSETRFAENDFEDVAYFEPFYLKDFVATVSKKGLHY